MNANDKIEREISLAELFWGILLKWRRIICCLIICTIFTCAIKYYRDLVSYNDGVEKEEVSVNAEESLNNLKDQLTEEELQEIEDVYVLQYQYQQSRDYITNSKLMSIDSYKENVAAISYYVDSHYTFNYTKDNQENKVKEVIAAYCSYISSGEMSEQIIQNNDMEIEEKYMTELISAKINSERGAVFEVYIIYDDVKQLDNIVKSLDAGIEEQTSIINESIGKHTITKISERVEVRTDTELAEYQKSQMDRMVSLRAQINTLKSAMSEEQLEIIVMEDLLENQKNETETNAGEVEITQTTKPGISIKYVMLGAVLGVFLACIWTILELLFAVRLLNTKELNNMYGLRLFGEITGGGKKNRFLPFIDNFILNIKNKNKKKMTYMQQQYILCSNIEIACKKENLKTIYLTGSEIDKVDEKIILRIVKELSNSGISVHHGMSINYDAKSLKEMADTGNVVFIEQTGISLYQEIADELRVANEQKINILGTIAISQ